ncbi:LON peptidase substrate-binding domain-containing protein [Microbacterium sp. CJ88]|uniref:LON peptidase substrate-binding domain-containing protein n=1 Tax=Microbacterium sp. CJ88 TaxID=3445672 RepID=UPI003F65E294
MEAATAMFPLGSVLFPYMPLPLRIFEERYRIMLGRVLDDEEPSFGVVLIERGSEAGGGDERFGIGTLARVTHVAAGREDVNVVARGADRIRVVEWLPDDPYPRALVRPVEALVWNDDLEPLRAEADRTVRRVLARASEFTDFAWDPAVELSDDPVEACWQLAAISPLGELDQLTLLRSTSLGGLLATLIDLTLEAEPGLTAP